MKLIHSQIKPIHYRSIAVLAALLMANTAVNAHSHKQDESMNGENQEVQTHSEEGKKHMHKHRKGRMQKRHEWHMDRIDTNQDGDVDLNEYLDNAKQRFSEMDVNSDNVVTGEEAREHHKSMRKKHKKHFKERKQKHKEMHKESKEEKAKNAASE